MAAKRRQSANDVEVLRGPQGVDCFASYLLCVTPQRQLRRQVLAVSALAAMVLGGCGVEHDDSDRWRRAGPWADLPAETAMPVAAADDPAAYRGVRFRIGQKPGEMPHVEAAGKALPWMRTSIGPGYGSAAQEGGGPLFGYQQMADGRRRMVWFFRFVGPALGTSEHEGAVLDVLVLPGEIESGFRSGCAFDPVIIDGENAWRLNQTSGRFEAVSPNKVRCPRGD